MNRPVRLLPFPSFPVLAVRSSGVPHIPLPIIPSIASLFFTSLNPRFFVYSSHFPILVPTRIPNLVYHSILGGRFRVPCTQTIRYGRSFVFTYFLLRLRFSVAREKTRACKPVSFPITRFHSIYLPKYLGHKLEYQSTREVRAIPPILPPSTESHSLYPFRISLALHLTPPKHAPEGRAFWLPSRFSKPTSPHLTRPCPVLPFLPCLQVR